MNESLPADSPFAFSDRDLEISIPQRFERIVDLLPHEPAVVNGDQTLSYDELNAAANRVAHLILARAASSDAPVALLMQNDLPILGTILGVLKSGKAYSALNPAFPLNHNNSVVADLQSELILTDTANLAQALQLAGDRRQVINVEALDAVFPASNPQQEVAPEALAAIFYTSGTTGMPKGVMRSHINLLHRGLILEHVCPVRPGDVTSMLYPCSVGASSSDLYVTLLSGATLNLSNASGLGPEGLSSWLLSDNITRLHLHTSVLRQLLDSLPPELFFPKLRYVRPSDRLYYGDVRRLRHHVPASAVIAHGLSSSETGNVTKLIIGSDLGADDEIVPVGYPVYGVTISLVDENGKEVSSGTAGEILVSSYSVVKGYWRRPELTSAKFLQDPTDSRRRMMKMSDLGRLRPDGSLELLSRTDQMVKIRGHRVEIGLVEATLERLPSVRRAAVIVREDHQGERSLIAYVEPMDIQAANRTALRQQLHELLPAAMVPSRFILLGELPLLPNGKVNRRALPAQDAVRPDLNQPYVEPRTPVEVELVDIWATVLGIDQVGIQDSFFELGGHSLQAARIVSRVLRAFKVDLAPGILFESPTVAAMALAITQQQAAQLDDEELDRILSELESMLDDGDGA